MRVALYGATGYTGRLVAEELSARGHELVLGGRDRARLEELAERVGAAAARVARTSDPPALRALLEDCEIVVNCAGPFARVSEPVVRAAVEVGVHYVDSTGEQAFIRTVLEGYGPAAERRGVVLVPALGFDYALGDCLARVVAIPREPLADLRVFYAAEDGASQGTVRSALDALSQPALVYKDGAWREGGAVPPAEPIDFGPPFGHAGVTLFPAGEPLTVPRHTRTRSVSGWLALRSLAPHPALAPLIPVVRPALAPLLRSPLRLIVDAAVGRLPEGPAPQARARARFAIVAEAVGEDGGRGRGVVRGHDPYHVTAACLAWGAERLVEGEIAPGGRSPAQAFDAAALLDGLAPRGLSWELSETGHRQEWERASG